MLAHFKSLLFARSLHWKAPLCLAFFSMIPCLSSVSAQDGDQPSVVESENVPSIDSEEMICRDIGDIVCFLEELSRSVAQSSSLAAKRPPRGPGQPGVGRTVIDLQSERQEFRLRLSGRQEPLEVEVINLSPKVNSWYLLKLVWDSKRIEWYHIDNANPQNAWFELNPTFRGGLWIRDGKGSGSGCELWGRNSGQALKTASEANAPFVGLCKGAVYLRNRIDGYRTTKEWVTEFLRSQVWGGETITNIVKETVFKDSFLITSDPRKGRKAQEAEETSNGPKNPLMAPAFTGVQVPAVELGIPIQGSSDGNMELGRWYRAKLREGVYVSLIEPRAIDSEIFKSYRSYVKDLDAVELNAVAYLVAFDLSQFEMGFSLGTDHPAVAWSERVLPEVKDNSLKGPDGFDTTEPVVRTGLLPPFLSDRLVGIFTGGFKRDHGAFRWGELSRKNLGSHYGFMENGVVLSTPVSGLSSVIVTVDGKVEMKTWTDADSRRQNEMRFIRQNGVPILEWNEDKKQGIPGQQVSNWTLGNWSGSQDKKFRTLRAGVCQQAADGRSFIIYGYFSSMTPSAMARVFQAYGCDYAMHLDMNALEHTYMTLYERGKGSELTPQHLIKGMKVLDERFKGNVPRYIGYPDNRDFFYLLQKKRPGE